MSVKVCDAKAKLACGHMVATEANTLQKKEHMHNTPDTCTYVYEVGCAQHNLHKTGGRDGKGIWT